MKGQRRDLEICRRLGEWFAKEARDLPWRRVTRRGARGMSPSGRDPYQSLVAEVMLQQTQVSRVLEKWGEFFARFPSLASLAHATEQEVLAAWSGMGYYRRARSLHAAAQQIVAREDGRVPSTAVELAELPGIGPYTAGALASIVFGAREAAVDGNVARVVCRIEGRDAVETEAERMAWVWDRARTLVAATDAPGVLNEAMMELGALVCAPSSPRCDACPVSRFCRARAAGRQAEIPAPKARSVRRRIFHSVALVLDSSGRVLVEQRPVQGLWASMWQAPTIESESGHVSVESLREQIGGGGWRRYRAFSHTTTHREVLFEVWKGSWRSRKRPKRGIWAEPGALQSLPFSNPQRDLMRAVMNG